MCIINVFMVAKQYEYGSSDTKYIFLLNKHEQSLHGIPNTIIYVHSCGGRYSLDNVFRMTTAHISQ